MSTGGDESQFKFLIQQGASNFTASLINHGKSIGLAKRGIERIVPDVSPAVMAAVLDTGTKQAEAARAVQGELLRIVGSNRFILKPTLPPGIEAGIRKPVTIRNIPIVHGIFGLDTEGDRVRFDVDIGFDPDRATRQFTFIFPHAPTWRELYEAARDRLRELAGQYPEKFPYAPEQIEEFVIVSITNVVRAF